jgi:hypothetical protein
MGEKGLRGPYEASEGIYPGLGQRKTGDGQEITYGLAKGLDL